MDDQIFVSYLRVSTAEQGQSGLGLEAQRYAVSEYITRVSSSLIAEFVEIESGNRNDRPQLKSAVELCKKGRATLIIAKLDRLARNVAFISTLMESGISFIAADNPHANKLMIHMLAAFAEHERDQIRARTKAALAAAKARGVVLGRYGREVLAKRNRAQAINFAQQLAPVLVELREHFTFEEMAHVMNERGISTARRGRWHTATVHRLFRRAAAMQRNSG